MAVAATAVVLFALQGDAIASAPFGGAPTGMRPRWAADGASIECAHRWELFVGLRR